MQPIRKAIIPAAGLGTRMLPIVDLPARVAFRTAAETRALSRKTRPVG